MPDEAAVPGRGSGELATARASTKQIERMIADPRARQALDEFASQWLRFDLVLNAVKDRALYPQFTPELAVAMTEETRRLIADLVWNDRNFMDMFTAGYTYVNSDLASLYGSPPLRERVRPSVRYPRQPDVPESSGRRHFSRRPASRAKLRRRSAAIRARALPLPAGSRPAAGNQQQPAAGDAGQAANESRTASRTHDQPDLRGVPQPDGSDRFRP